MRITKYIAALAVLLCSVGCTMNELDELSGNINGAGSDSAVRVFGYISHYDGCTVSSRADGGAAKDPTVGETKVSNMGFAVFKMNDTDGKVGDLVYYDYQSGSNITFVLERDGAMLDNDGDGTEETPVEYDAEVPYAMYVFTNMPNMPKTWFEAKKMSLDDFKAKSYEPTKSDYEKAVGIGIPSAGFPMMGSIGDYYSEGGDGHKLVLVPNSENMEVPTVDGTPKDLLEVPMDVLYAKMRFTIKVDPDQSIEGMNTPKFTMENYTIHNIPEKVCLDVNDNKSNNTNTYTVASWNNGAEGLKVDMASSADGSQTGVISFDFYLPEQLVTPAILSTAYPYPFVGAEGGTPSASDDRIREEDEGLRQRYKPELLGVGQNAPYITINGTYVDHQTHSWDVSYKIYLGSDNYGNFEVKRNTLYENIVTIRGVQNSNDQSDVNGSVAIDHRVDIKRTQPFIIGLRRECLLDAHFEVRPLRIRKNSSFGDIPDNAAVRVSVSYLDDDRQPVNLAKANRWVGLERSYGDGASTTNATYIHKEGDDTYPSNGKRKYFTTDLTTNTLGENVAPNGFSTSGGQTVVVPMPKADSDEQCVWIYIDECTAASPDIEAQRFAKVVVEYGTVANNGNFFPDSNLAPVTYILAQHKLHQISSDSRIYYIEHDEEYLYNFDSNDTFTHTPTFDSGLQWGLNNVQLSKEHLSFSITEDNDDWKQYIKDNPTLLTYDFYTWGQDEEVMTANGISVPDEHKEFAGQHFTEVIAENSNANVEYLTMADPASGAVEYCYNRNRRNPDGTVDVKWYLPSADELEDFIVEAYGYYEEFQDNYYWTSQPAYNRNAFYYEYKERGGVLNLGTTTVDTYVFNVYEDNTKYARATRVGYDLQPIQSGLNNEPPMEGVLPDSEKANNPDVGYFSKWHQWKRARSGAVTTDTVTDEDQFFWEFKDKVDMHRRYYGFVSPNYDMTKEEINPNYDMRQKGYQLRTKKNRIRCAYRKVN